MRCFNHPDVEAVGKCKACCRGFCRECATDLEHGLACKDHVTEAESLNVLITRNTRITAINTKSKFVVPEFYAFLGLTFVGYGLVSSNPSSFPIVMGAGFLAFALFNFAANLKAFGK
jgi:hypothetical protein